MRQSVAQRRLLSCLIAVGLVGLVEIPAIHAASLKSNANPSVGSSDPQPLGLKLRRLPNSFELVVVGTGQSPLLTQTSRAGEWLGTLSFATPRARIVRPRLFSLPEAGIESVSLSGGGTQFSLSVKGLNGITYSSAEVFADGNDLILKFPLPAAVVTQTARPNVLQPGTVPASNFTPPLQPRAVAPPLGDMAVGSMVLRNQSFVKAVGPKVTLTLKNAPAKDALMAIARLGGYGFVFVDDDAMSAASSSAGGATVASSTGRLVTLSFVNEKYDQALNSILLASGFQGKLDGKMLLVGQNVLGKTFGPQVSKTYRLNQATAASAADYLASLGASISKINTLTSTSSSSDTAGTASSSASSTTAVTETITTVETYGASVGPLKGLSGTTDSRLQTITLIGDSALVAVASSYLRQLDLRQRQVAVKVQILNIDLENDATIDSSFSARFGNTFLVSQNGRAYMNFGENKPGGRDGTGVVVDGTEYVTPGSYSAGTEKVQAERLFPPYVIAKERVETTNVLPDGSVSRSFELVDKLDDLGRPIYVPSNNPSESYTSLGLVDSFGRPILVPGQNSNEYTQPKNSFYSYLEAAIVATSAKTLAQPTLLVQEGQKAVVKTATSVITGVETTEASNGSTQLTNTRAEAGLILDVMVNKIDDNGFITLELKPSVSVPLSAGTQQGVQIFNISQRSLSSGAVRLRDGQTLVVTGVITDQDRARVTKWPILGDMPIIGQLFRNSTSSRQKSELVMLVTPTLVDDVDGGAYGYGYRPMTKAARELMQ